MKKMLPMMLGLLLARSAAALDPVEISATKKTVDTRKSTGQALWRGTSRATEKSVVYRFDLKRQSADIPEYAKVQWVVLVEGALGHVIAPRTSGESAVGLPLNQVVSVETEPFLVRGREWTSGPNPGTVEEQIVGYGVRLLDSETGRVLAEHYGPPSVKDRIAWEPLGHADAEEPRPVRGRLLRRQVLEPDAP